MEGGIGGTRIPPLAEPYTTYQQGYQISQLRRAACTPRTNVSVAKESLQSPSILKQTCRHWLLCMLPLPAAKPADCASVDSLG